MSPEKPSTAQKIDLMRDAYRGFERGALEIFMNIIRDDAVRYVVRLSDYLRPRLSTA